MKNRLFLGLLLVLAVSLCACSSNNVHKEETETTNAQLESMWVIDQKVDEFNDKTNIDYIRSQPFSGTFSNTATTNSALSVIIYYDPDFIWFDDPNTIHSSSYDSIISFRLLEYNSNKASYSNSSDMILKFKLDDKSYSIELAGSSPNGDLYYVEDSWKSTNYEAERQKNPKNIFLRALEQQEDIKCIIEIDSSKYSFVIDTTGYADSLSILKQKYNYNH